MGSLFKGSSNLNQSPSYYFQHLWTKGEHRIRFTLRFNNRADVSFRKVVFSKQGLVKQWVIEKTNVDLRYSVTAVIIQIWIWTKEPQSTQFNYIYFILKFIFVYNCRRDCTRKLTWVHCLHYLIFLLLFLSSERKNSNQNAAVPVVTTFNKCFLWCFHYLTREYMIHRVSKE